MARRRSDLGAGSLDLLLDTVCNVFGGIVLMAILVVLQTQTSAKGIPDPDARDVERALEARRLSFECGQLEERAADLAQHRDEVSRTFRATTSPTGERLADAQEEFRKAIDEAQRRVKAAEAEAAAGRKGQVQHEDLLRTADQSLKEKQREVAGLEEQAREAQESRPHQVRLPHRRGLATGTARYYVVKGRRAYLLDPQHRLDWYGGEQRLGHCTVVPLAFARGATVAPIEGAGYAVPDGAGGADAFMSSLRGFPANDYYVMFFVYADSDSFAAFQTLKDAVVGSRYRYAFAPVIPQGGSFTVGPVAGHETE